MIERRRYTTPLLYWATERESIRLEKAASALEPWSDDPIFQRYRFCNVRRRDDRVSQWLIANVFPMLKEGMGRWTFIRVIALCRWINWPPTIRVILELDKPWQERTYVWKKDLDLKRIGEEVERLVSTDTKAWTGAYMVRAPSKKQYPGVSKGGFVSEIVVGNGLDLVQGNLMEAIDSKFAERVWGVVNTAHNWGSFMAGQLVADLTYTPLLDQAYDLNTWAPVGPGSKRGFNRLMGRPLKQKIDAIEWSDRLQEWRLQVAEVIGSDLNLMDLQNCLCELDKYLRVKNGEGRPRATYKPETAY